MAAKKKIEPKKPAKAEPKKAIKVTATTPSGIVSQLVAAINKDFGGEVVRRATDATTSHALRRPTGIPDLDMLGLAGGFPGGALSVITGPDGAGKDYLINCVIREIQRNYGDDTKVAIFSTEFPYDKKFAKDVCGVQVALNTEEIEEINAARAAQGLPLLTEEEEAHYRKQIGEILLIQGVIADHGLDIVLRVLETGAFQLIAINSLGVFETAAKDDTENLQDHAPQSSEAQLLARFIPKMFMLLNRPLPDGKRNETTLLAANQVRANRDQPRMRPGMPVPAHLKYQSGSGSRALAHGKAIDVTLHKGGVLLDKEVDPPAVLGRTINWELTKGKLGTHDSKKGSYEFYFDGGADVASSLLSMACRYEVIEQAGAWYSYKAPSGDKLSFRVQGSDNAQAALMDPEMYRSVYDATLKAVKVICRYR